MQLGWRVCQAPALTVMLWITPVWCPPHHSTEAAPAGGTQNVSVAKSNRLSSIFIFLVVLSSETERPPFTAPVTLVTSGCSLTLTLLGQLRPNHLLFLVVTKDSVLHCSCRTIPETMPCSPVPFDSICMLNPKCVSPAWIFC